MESTTTQPNILVALIFRSPMRKSFRLPGDLLAQRAATWRESLANAARTCQRGQKLWSFAWGAKAQASRRDQNRRSPRSHSICVSVLASTHSMWMLAIRLSSYSWMSMKNLKSSAKETRETSRRPVEVEFCRSRNLRLWPEEGHKFNHCQTSLARTRVQAPCQWEIWSKTHQCSKSSMKATWLIRNSNSTCQANLCTQEAIKPCLPKTRTTSTPNPSSSTGQTWATKLKNRANMLTIATPICPCPARTNQWWPILSTSSTIKWPQDRTAKVSSPRNEQLATRGNTQN